jgi:hypothetical protein
MTTAVARVPRAAVPHTVAVPVGEIACVVGLIAGCSLLLVTGWKSPLLAVAAGSCVAALTYILTRPAMRRPTQFILTGEALAVRNSMMRATIPFTSITHLRLRPARRATDPADAFLLEITTDAKHYTFAPITLNTWRELVDRCPTAQLMEQSAIKPPLPATHLPFRRAA